MTAVMVKIDEQCVEDCLLKICAGLSSAKSETVLDFSTVQRVDGKAIRAMEELAALKDAKTVKVQLLGVNVEIYKVLKLVRLSRRFSFLN